MSPIDHRELCQRRNFFPFALDAIDAQLEKYNQDRGLQPGMAGYAPKLKRAIVQGRTLINEPKAEFAAKYALSNQDRITIIKAIQGG